MNELRLYIPRPEDGWFYVKMLTDPATMAYNAPWFPPDGCIPGAAEEWDDLCRDWIGQEPTRFYAYLQRVSNGAFVGDVNYHLNGQGTQYDMGVVIYAPERGKGYGKAGLRLLLDKALRVDGVPALHNDFETDRDAACRIHRAVGFREVGCKDGILHLALTREEYLASCQEKEYQEATMAHIVEIQDFSDPNLDVYARLTENQLKNRLHPEDGLFIAESPKVIGTALDAGLAPVSLLTERRHIAGSAAALLPRLGDIPVYTADDGLLSKLTGYDLTRGVLCAMRRPQDKTVAEVLQGASRVAVLENIVDSTNLGAIFRSAAALGMDAVLLSPACCDPLLRRAVRVSMGTVFQIPWARLDSWDTLKQAGFVTLAMALKADALSLDDPVLGTLNKVAIVLGTEGDGLTAETIAACDHTVMIPMAHGVDSLNVGNAAAVAFWALRHRL